MRAQLLKYWDHLRTSFWFLPSLMAAVAVGLSFVTVWIDQSVADDGGLDKLGWAYTGGAEGASGVLQTIAGSMITIAGVVFSLTLVALSLASSQFGPRLLRNFMRDTTVQFVLGTFVATFLFCLLVLRTVRHSDEGAFVPHVSVTIGVVSALMSLWVLIYFIHHVAVSIQADDLVSRVGAELGQSIEHLFPEQIGQAERGREGRLPDDFARDGRRIPAEADGYFQLVDAETLLRLACERDVVLRLERRPGHYVVCGTALAIAWPAERVDDAFVRRVHAAIVFGTQRTPTQDVEFAVNQLVEVAVRALSPGVNDPFTAISCIDRLGSALGALAQREMPSGCRFDDDGQLRVVAPATTFEGVADAAFDQIRQYGAASPAVAIRLLETIAVVASLASRPADCDALRRHAEMIAEEARAAASTDHDRHAIEGRHAAVRDALDARGAA